MGFESGPSFGPESLPAIEEIARLEVLAEIQHAAANIAREGAASEIAADPILQALLSKLIESGPELDPAIRRYLRMMAAIRMHNSPDEIAHIEEGAEFYELIASDLQSELAELEGFEQDLVDLPDLWGIAYEDLMRLEGDQLF